VTGMGTGGPLGQISLPIALPVPSERVRVQVWSKIPGGYPCRSLSICYFVSSLHVLYLISMAPGSRHSTANICFSQTSIESFEVCQGRWDYEEFQRNLVEFMDRSISLHSHSNNQQPHLVLLTNVGRRPLGFWLYLHPLIFLLFTYFICKVSKNTSYSCGNTTTCHFQNTTTVPSCIPLLR